MGLRLVLPSDLRYHVADTYAQPRCIPAPLASSYCYRYRFFFGPDITFRTRHPVETIDLRPAQELNTLRVSTP